LAGAHTALAQVFIFRSDFAALLKSSNRGDRFLDPNYATAHHWYANGTIACVGRLTKQLPEGARAVELDPLSPIINCEQANNSIIAGRYDEAITKSVKHSSSILNLLCHSNLGLALEFKGDLPGAIAEFRRAHQLDGDPLSLAYLGKSLCVRLGNVTNSEHTDRTGAANEDENMFQRIAFALVQADWQ